MPSRAAPSAAPASAPEARSIVSPVTSAIIWRPEFRPRAAADQKRPDRPRPGGVEHVDAVGEREGDALHDREHQRIGAVLGP